MANNQKEKREQANRDKYGTSGLPPETENMTSDEMLRQIESLRSDLKKAGVQETEDEYYTEEDGTKNFEKKSNGQWKFGYHPNTKKNLWTAENRPPGGRGKGSKNRKTLRQEANDRGQYTPAEFLLGIVNDENCNMNQRISAAKEAAKYYDPALSSVEHHSDEGDLAPFNIFLGNINKPKTVTIEVKDLDKDELEELNVIEYQKDIESHNDS